MVRRGKLGMELRPDPVDQIPNTDSTAAVPSGYYVNPEPLQDPGIPLEEMPCLKSSESSDTKKMEAEYSNANFQLDPESEKNQLGVPFDMPTTELLASYGMPEAQEDLHPFIKFGSYCVSNAKAYHTLNVTAEKGDIAVAIISETAFSLAHIPSKRATYETKSIFEEFKAAFKEPNSSQMRAYVVSVVDKGRQIFNMRIVAVVAHSLLKCGIEERNLHTIFGASKRPVDDKDLWVKVFSPLAPAVSPSEKEAKIKVDLAIADSLGGNLYGLWHKPGPHRSVKKLMEYIGCIDQDEWKWLEMMRVKERLKEIEGHEKEVVEENQLNGGREQKRTTNKHKQRHPNRNYQLAQESGEETQQAQENMATPKWQGTKGRERERGGAERRHRRHV
ncbi:hypothetical protein BGW36DRAFT_353468 [Talaromyces proteolyticus]|uniref:Uncharacterized protein n=1 Tax=Talaromyces proteolyticus TaxID=1131652 RepID=A0AAD4Q0Z1_9EURO|nr:uncharacterized protein BGW36DRAFT_353468 [Talaromyces proteolyticus]KAH8705040.1 hypothetical protein BGW36DRAFT_353468 [Talaromyces proteolyticus]